MRKPNLIKREQDIFAELGLEMKGLNYLTKQNLSKPVKRLDVKG